MLRTEVSNYVSILDIIIDLIYHKHIFDLFSHQNKILILIWCFRSKKIYTWSLNFVDIKDSYLEICLNFVVSESSQRKENTEILSKLGGSK